MSTSYIYGVDAQGEVGCFGDNKEEAFLKAMLSTGQTVPIRGGKIMVSIQSSMREAFMPTLKKLSVRPGSKSEQVSGCSCMPDPAVLFSIAGDGL